MRGRHLGAAQRVRCAVLAVLALIASVGHAESSNTGAPQRVPVSSGDWALALGVAGGETRVAFRGEFDADQGGAASGHMVYPAPNFVGFLAAVATHAVIAGGSRKAQREQAEAQADSALTPLKPTLDLFSIKELTELARAQLPSAPSGDWSVEASPVYFFSRDLRSLSVESPLSVRRKGSEEVLARTTVRATAAPASAKEAAEYWSADGGRALKQTASRLLAEAVRLGMREVSGEWDQVRPAARTIRFPSGESERIERVQLLESRCGQAVVRHLRGDLMLVPWQDPEHAERCPTGTMLGRR